MSSTILSMISSTLLGLEPLLGSSKLVGLSPLKMTPPLVDSLNCRLMEQLYHECRVILFCYQVGHISSTK